MAWPMASDKKKSRAKHRISCLSLSYLFLAFHSMPNSKFPSTLSTPYRIQHVLHLPALQLFYGCSFPKTTIKKNFLVFDASVDYKFLLISKQKGVSRCRWRFINPKKVRKNTQTSSTQMRKGEKIFQLSRQRFSISSCLIRYTSIPWNAVNNHTISKLLG
jgi:hypothetical protein